MSGPFLPSCTAPISSRSKALSPWKMSSPLTVNARNSEASDPSGRAQQSHGQRHHCPHQLQRSFHGDPDNAEGKQEQPYDRIQHERQQRQRPTQHKQQAPKQENEH